jgi:VanZ family protein
LSEIQPWRHNRKLTPEQTAQLRQAAESSLGAFLRAWWPAILWAAIIFSLSTDIFSSEHTAIVFSPILHWVVPSLSDQQFDIIHHFIRKSAHFAEYFIFCLLLYRGVRGSRPGWRWIWGLSAWFTAAAYSALDEVHQAFVASRTASPYDSLLDSVGALCALAFLYLWFRFKTQRPPAIATQ